MLEIGLRRSCAALLEFIEVVCYLIRFKCCRQAAEVQRQCRNMAAVVIKGARTSAQDGNVAFKTLEQALKAFNFANGAVQIFIVSECFRRFFFVAISYKFCER